MTQHADLARGHRLRAPGVLSQAKFSNLRSDKSRVPQACPRLLTAPSRLPGGPAAGAELAEARGRDRQVQPGRRRLDWGSPVSSVLGPLVGTARGSCLRAPSRSQLLRELSCPVRAQPCIHKPTQSFQANETGSKGSSPHISLLWPNQHHP